MKFENSDYPAMYSSADDASLKAQRRYFGALWFYLILLISATFVSFYWSQYAYGAILSATLFIISLGILVCINTQRPEDGWYNSRAVAESIKTRTWRWMMMAEPYNEGIDDDQARRNFLSDQKAILGENQTLSNILQSTPGEAISKKMVYIRNLSWEKRLSIYKNNRIEDQAVWYKEKSQFNKRQAKKWYIVSIFLHLVAFIMLLYRIKEPNISLPIEVVATAAGAVLTWVQSKKYSELSSSYTLASQEIILVKGELELVKNKDAFSDFVLNSESAFSREHTKWIARRR